MTCEGIIGNLVTVVCTLVAILVVPGTTVLINQILEFRQKRERLFGLLDECEECGKTWVQSTTVQEWEAGRRRLIRLYRELGSLKESLPVVGGGEAQSAELVGSGYLIGTGQAMLTLMILNSQDAGPTPGQKKARSRDLTLFREWASELKQMIGRAEEWEEFRAHLVRELLGIYKSLWHAFAGWLGRPQK